MPRWLLCGVCVLLAAAAALDEIDNNSLNANEPDAKPETETDVKLPSEVQRAVCTVNAGEVKASAEAVTTKTLKGVCGSDEMRLAFHQLEEKIFGELRELKEQLKKLNALLEHPSATSKPLTPEPQPLPKPEPEPFTRPPIMKIIKFEEISQRHPSQEKKQPQLKDMQSAPKRKEEIEMFNNTMLADQDFQLFTYYWKLENITEHLSDTTTKSVRSPMFGIRGKTLQLMCTFQYLRREMISLQLVMAYPTTEHGLKGKENNIMLDMGGQWKQLKWADHVTFKHKISLLDQNHSHRRTQDLSSQELNKLDTGFSIPNSAILGSNYVRQNSLLIQIILYL